MEKIDDFQLTHYNYIVTVLWNSFVNLYQFDCE